MYLCSHIPMLTHSDGPLLLARQLAAEFLNCPPRKAEMFCGLGDIAVGCGEGLRQQLSLCLFAQLSPFPKN